MRPDPMRFIQFLSRFGSPLPYYGRQVGAHPSHAAIWRIKYDAHDASLGETHAVDGPLPAHSSQSLRVPRPPYFSMLMVDNGWQDGPAGQNGESIFVQWSDAFAQMKFEAPLGYKRLVDLLLADVPYPGGEAVRSVAYILQSQRSDFDIGVRLKSDLLEHLRTNVPDHPATSAVEYLVRAAATVARRVQMHSGDCVIVDNDRWGHGRETVVGQRRVATTDECNPRELWSVTLG